MQRAAEPRPHVDRLLAFTDAVVAIAITLLVLPLAELFAEAPDPRDAAMHTSAALLQRLGDHSGQIGAFLLSFVIIARLWWAHHRVSSHLRASSAPVVVVDLFWTLTIVIIPVTTAIIPDYEPWPLSFGLYTGALLLSSVALTVLALIAHRDARVSTGRSTATRDSVIGIAATALAVAVALLVGLVVPLLLGGRWGAWSFLSLLLLAVTGPFERRLKRRPLREA